MARLLRILVTFFACLFLRPALEESVAAILLFGHRALPLSFLLVPTPTVRADLVVVLALVLLPRVRAPAPRHLAPARMQAGSWAGALRGRLVHSRVDQQLDLFQVVVKLARSFEV